MKQSRVGKRSRVNSKTDDNQETIVREYDQLCSDFLLQTWLLVDKMLPEQFSHIRDAPKTSPSLRRGLKGQNTSYSNFMMFLCVANTLNEKGSLTMGDLSRAIAVPVSTATRMVDWMVDSEYAERLPDSNDRRIVRVALTDKGRNLSKEAKRHLFEHAAEFLRRLPESQRKTLLINVKEVISAWTSVLENSP